MIDKSTSSVFKASCSTFLRTGGRISAVVPRIPSYLPLTSLSFRFCFRSSAVAFSHASRKDTVSMTEPLRTRSNAPSLSIPSTSTPHPTSQELSPTDAPPSQLQDQPKSVPPTADVVAAAQTTREESKIESQSQELAPIKLDIEHLKVDDDPRLWSNTRKSSVLA